MNKKIILYSTGCPNCKLLKEYMDKKDIIYEENNSVDDMVAKGFDHVPMLEVDGEIYDFNEALMIIKKYVMEVNNYED